MTRQEFIAKTAAAAKMHPATVANCFGAAAAVVREALSRGEEVIVPGVGKLAAQCSAARPGRNPRTGEAFVVPARTRVKLRAQKDLRDALNTHLVEAGVA